LLLQFVYKWNAVLCCNSCTLFQVVYKQNSFPDPKDRHQQLAWWLLSWTPLDAGNHCVSIPWIVLWSLDIIIYMDQSFIHSYDTVKKPHTILPKLRLFGNPFGWELSHF
jgi:hypothetical protein